MSNPAATAARASLFKGRLLALAAIILVSANLRSAVTSLTPLLDRLGHVFDFGSTMTGVLGMSELLLSTSLKVDQQGQVRSIRRAGEHLLRLVNDALDLARIEAGRLDLEDGRPFPRVAWHNRGAALASN